jgi:hypothetical protein
MVQTIRDALKAARFYSDGELYALLQLPPQAIIAAAGVLAEIAEPFAALIADKDEVTLIIHAEEVETFARRMPGYTSAQSLYRLITLDVLLEPTLVGFMAMVGQAVARAGVSIIPLGAYSRDHLLVPENQFDAAMNALKKLQASL